ncbi:putative transcription factor interactor and regulator CCHC(Zn) family [Helianthus debilis subsp. tardiflorus]
MASLVRRAQRFMKITGRNSLSGPDCKLGFDKLKVTCFKCKEKGHFKRECPNREVNNHQNPFSNDYYRQAIYHKTRQQPLTQRPQIENKPEKALLVNQDDEKVAEGFSWDKYIPGSEGRAMMAEIVEEPERTVETEEILSEESLANHEEAAAEVYYYQSEQEIIASSFKSIMPPNMFDSFAGFFNEPTTGFCPRYDVEKVPVEEIIDVSKEMNEETLKQIADKALMGKLKEVETESIESKSVETESVESVSVKTVKKESDEKSKNEEIKSAEKSESECDGFGKTDIKIDSEEKVSEKVDSIHEVPCKNCSKPFMDCLEKDKQLQELKKFTDEVKYDLSEIKEAYDTLARSIKMIKQESFENDKATKLLKSTVMDKQMEINIHLDTIASLKKELELMRIETKRVDKKLMSYDVSSYVINQILPQQHDAKPVFKSVPPPMWNHYTQKYPDGVESALNLKLRTIENELPENIDVTFSPSDTDNESQVIKTVVSQVLDEESDNSEFDTVKTHFKNSISDSEEDGNFLDNTEIRKSCE